MKKWAVATLSYLFVCQAILGKLLFGPGYPARMLTRCHPAFIAPVLRRFGAHIGKKVHFKSHLFLDNYEGDEDASGDFSHLRIGDGCYIGHGVFFDLPDQITLGNECLLGAGVRIFTHEDAGGRPLSRWYPRKKGAVRIGAGTWIGAGAIVLHGVQLGKCCVVGAGAVVRDSFPDYCVIAGSPARLVKTLNA
jgi:acetyltransferase-like isoleucine patch superfamily enzyme